MMANKSYFIQSPQKHRPQIENGQDWITQGSRGIKAVQPPAPPSPQPEPVQVEVVPGVPPAPPQAPQELPPSPGSDLPRPATFAEVQELYSASVERIPPSLVGLKQYF